MSKSKSRNSGQRAYREVLQLATVRLERAESEMARCNQRVLELSAEIPQLRDMIAVTRRFLGMDKTGQNVEQPAARPRRPNLIAGIPADRVPKDIQEFLNPKGATTPIKFEQYTTSLPIVDSSDEEGALLPSIGGEEVLP